MAKKKVNLKAIWAQRLKLRAEGDKLCDCGDKLWDDGKKTYDEGNNQYVDDNSLMAHSHKLIVYGNKSMADGNMLIDSGNKLKINGDKLWADGIISAHGNVLIKWKYMDGDYACIVKGVTYKHRKVRVTLKQAMKDLKKIK